MKLRNPFSRKRKTFILPTKGIKRGVYSSEETIDTFRKLEEFFNKKIDTLEENTLKLVQDIGQAQQGGEQWYYWGSGRTRRQPSGRGATKGLFFPEQFIGKGVGAGGDPWGDPFYIMRRGTRLMRGGVPTGVLSAFRRILYTVGGPGLLIAGIFAFSEQIVNIIEGYVQRQVEIQLARKAIEKRQQEQRERARLLRETYRGVVGA